MRFRKTRFRRGRILGAALTLTILAAALATASCHRQGPAGEATAGPTPGEGRQIEGSYDELYRLYRPGSASPPSEREAAYTKYAGGIVTWSGPFHMARRSPGGIDAEFVHVRDDKGKASATSRVTFGPELAKQVFDLVPGQVVTYQARLVKIDPGAQTLTFVLDQGKIVKVRDRD